MVRFFLHFRGGVTVGVDATHHDATGDLIVEGALEDDVEHIREALLLNGFGLRHSIGERTTPADIAVAIKNGFMDLHPELVEGEDIIAPHMRKFWR